MTDLVVKISEMDDETLEQLTRVVGSYNRSILKGREKAPGKTKRPSVRLFDLDADAKEIKYLPQDMTLEKYVAESGAVSRGTEPGQIADQGANGDPALCAVVGNRDHLFEIQPVKVRGLKRSKTVTPEGDQPPAPESGRRSASRRDGAAARRKREPHPVQTD